MREPKRLSSGDDLGATLLSAARDDAPRASARAATAAALGLGAGVVAIAAGGAAAKAAAGASIAPKAIGASAGAGAKVAGALWLKLLGAGVVSVAVVGGVAWKVRHSSHADAMFGTRAQEQAQEAGPLATDSPVSPRPRETNAGPETPASATLPPEMPAVVEPAPEVAIPAPSSASAAPKAMRPGAAVATSTPSTTSAAPSKPETALTRELRSLDDARSALARGDASGALAELDRHDRAFPMGTLRTEAKVVRADALLARGDRAAARKLATELLARDPSGPHARHLQSIVELP